MKEEPSQLLHDKVSFILVTSPENEDDLNEVVRVEANQVSPKQKALDFLENNGEILVKLSKLLSEAHLYDHYSDFLGHMHEEFSKEEITLERLELCCQNVEIIGLLTGVDSKNQSLRQILHDLVAYSREVLEEQAGTMVGRPSFFHLLNVVQAYPLATSMAVFGMLAFGVYAYKQGYLGRLFDTEKNEKGTTINEGLGVSSINLT